MIIQIITIMITIMTKIMIIITTIIIIIMIITIIIIIIIISVWWLGGTLLQTHYIGLVSSNAIQSRTVCAYYCL